MTGDLLELTSPDDQYFNYCWWPYVPVAPTENKLRPVSLLAQSFAVAGVAESGVRLVRHIRAELGPARTVWGAKWAGGRLAWEFYFYDYQRRERSVSITRVLDLVRPLAPSSVRANESLPYFMFSLDVDAELLTGTRGIDLVHMYIGNPGSTVSSGIAYALTADSTTLENFYFFFDARRHMQDAAAKILCSAQVDLAAVPIDRLLRPELRDCHTICVANKRRHDTVYFSGVTVDQLLYFLEWREYPTEVTGFVRENRARLDHLLFDVGFDYTTRNGELVIEKSGYYGVF
jgi:hypothetical protein